MKSDKCDTLKKKLILELEKNRGLITISCKKVGIHRATYYRWLEKDKDFKEAADEVIELTIDNVESKLHENIDDNCKDSIKFYLSTKGKARGYIQRQEISHDVDTKSKLIEWKPAKDKE
tara:strand:- start:146 stop:502 length:357 start_codon:yes stop_codon:yes gene_type:complete